MPFLIFTAVIIIAVSICIMIGFHVDAMIGGIVGFACGVAMAVMLASFKGKEGADEIKISVTGAIMVFGVFVGAFLAFLARLALDNNEGIIFSFIGSVLGSVIGLMHKE